MREYKAKESTSAPTTPTATQDDITVVPGDEEMGFHCRACHTQFATMPISDVQRGRANGTLDQKVRLIVAEHVWKCPGPEADPTRKKPGRPHKG